VDLSHITWRKSRRSGNGPNCVEIAMADVHAADKREAEAEPLFLIRDSKNPDGAVLAFAPAEWSAFISRIKSGEFDHLV